MNAGEFNHRMIEVVAAIHAAEAEYEKQIHAAVQAEKSYKRREAIALLEIKDARNAQERAARAELLRFEDNSTLGDWRYAAHLAEGLRDSAKQAARSRTQELSALQSLASLAKEEARFIQTAPQEVQTA